MSNAKPDRPALLALYDAEWHWYLPAGKGWMRDDPTHLHWYMAGDFEAVDLTQSSGDMLAIYYENLHRPTPASPPRDVT